MKMSNSDIRKMVTDAIIEALESGTNPWRREWTPDCSGIPHNCITGHEYRGVNPMYLWAVQMNNGYSTAQWLTFNQARKAGGKVLKGEKATRVVFTKPVTYKDKDDPDKTHTAFMLRVYPVFNIAQTENVKLPKREQPTTEEASTKTESDIVKDAKAFMASHNAVVKYNGGRAYFDIINDYIGLPKPESFKSAEGFAATAYHELIHWTGHNSRLNRVYGSSKGTEEYAYEELIAEIGSAMLCQRRGVSSDLPNHASYVDSWLKRLKSDTQFIFKASRTAEKALDYLMPELAQEREAA